MQLKARALATAGALAVAALASPARAEEAPPETSQVIESSSIDVRASSEVAAYADTDHVYVVTPTIAGTIAQPTAGWTLDGRYLVDVVSAASVDIVSTASRRWEEVRHAGTVDFAYKPGSFGLAVNADVSSEPDYLSVTGGGSIQKDVLDKQATLLFGWSHGHDVAGRGGTPFSVFSRVIDRDGFKTGATLVVNRSTIASIVADAIVERGDTSKPYRYVPMFAPGTDVPKGASPDLVSKLRLSYRPLEQLPTSRDRFALSGRIAHRFDQTTFRADERLYADTWALLASTTDVRLVTDFSRRVQLGPHLRFHAQNAVVFWQRAYVVQPGLDFPALRTGDRELGPLWGLTAGGALRLGLGPDERPQKWLFGMDLNLMTTRYLDDIYLTHRESGIIALSLEVEL
jgi:hypothetical protein